MDDPRRLDTLFAALADPTRRALVTQLLDGDRSVSALAAPFDMSLAAVSKHIAVLSQAGLVIQTRTGRSKTCRLDTDALRPVLLWLETCGASTASDFDRLEDTLAAAGLIAEPDPTGDAVTRADGTSIKS
ncbi:MAG: metalloregulator ArsR/SmtB family transcription factor [Pseudomonadota bacterium]